MLLYNLQQYLVGLSIPEHFVNDLIAQGVFQSIESVFVGPITADAFENNRTGILLQRKLKDLINYSLSNGRALVFPEKLVAELDNIVAVGVSYQSINVKIHCVCKSLPDLIHTSFNHVALCF